MFDVEKFYEEKLDDNVIGHKFTFDVASFANDLDENIASVLGEVIPLGYLITKLPIDDIDGISEDVYEVLERKEELRKRGSYIPILSNAFMSEGVVKAMVLARAYSDGVRFDRLYFGYKDDLNILLKLIRDAVSIIKSSDYADKSIMMTLPKNAEDAIIAMAKSDPLESQAIFRKNDLQEDIIMVSEFNIMQIKYFGLQDDLDEYGIESELYEDDFGGMYLKVSDNIYLTYESIKDGAAFELSAWEEAPYSNFIDSYEESETGYIPYAVIEEFIQPLMEGKIQKTETIEDEDLPQYTYLGFERTLCKILEIKSSEELKIFDYLLPDDISSYSRNNTKFIGVLFPGIEEDYVPMGVLIFSESKIKNKDLVETIGQLSYMKVSSNYRKRGAASLLLSHFEENLKKKGIDKIIIMESEIKKYKDTENTNAVVSFLLGRGYEMAAAGLRKKIK